MSFCMSFRQIFGNFEHQGDGGADYQRERQKAVKEIQNKRKELQNKIEQRRQTIKALLDEVRPLMAQYKRLVAQPGKVALAEKFLKEKLAPLERRVTEEERYMRIDQNALEFGSRVQNTDAAGDERGEYLLALKQYTRFAGRRAGALDGENADEILSDITSVHLEVSTNNAAVSSSLESNLSRLNNETAIDADHDNAAPTDDIGAKNDMLRRLNARFELDDDDGVQAESVTNAQRAAPAPQVYRGSSTNTGVTEDAFPTAATGNLDNSNKGGQSRTTGRQAVATAVVVDATRGARVRHVTFDTDD
jgi:hypothetical protein